MSPRHGRSLVVGRDPSCDVVFPSNDTRVSRRHARFVPIGGGRWEVQDLGSANGVSVNGRRVEVAHVGPQDRVMLGSLVFDLSMLARHAAPPQTPARPPSPPPPQPTLRQAPMPVTPQFDDAPTELTYRERELLGYARAAAAVGALLVLGSLFVPFWDFSSGRSHRPFFLVEMFALSQKFATKAFFRSMILGQWSLIPLTAVGAGLSLSIRKDPLLVVSSASFVALVVHIITLWTYKPLLRSLRVSQIVEMDEPILLIGKAFSHTAPGFYLCFFGIACIVVATEQALRISGRMAAYKAGHTA